MASCALHLLVTLLAFTYLVPFNAVATSRMMHLLYEIQEIPAFEDINQIAPAEIAEPQDEEFGNHRIDFQSRDYPGSGANNRHTPRPPAAWEGRLS